ncbi:unnamed protein product, partial [Staurois parvus]
MSCQSAPGPYHIAAPSVPISAAYQCPSSFLRYA